MAKPTIRFKGYTEDWEQRRLGEVCQITMGQSPDGSTYSEEPSDYILVQGNADICASTFREQAVTQLIQTS